MSSTSIPLRPRRRWRWLRRSAAVWLVGVILLGIVRNPLTKYSLTVIGSHVLHAAVEIQQVQIGWGRITLIGLSIDEPGRGKNRLLTIRSLEIASRIASGMSDGIYLDRILVADPSVKLRVAGDGTLLTKFPIPDASEPESSSAELTLPVRRVLVSNASLAIAIGATRGTARKGALGERTSSPARTESLVSGMDVELVQSNGRIDVVTQISDVLRGQLEHRTSIDSKSLAGSSHLVLRGCGLDSRRWPLTLAASPQPVGYIADATVRAIHPGRDGPWQDHRITCKAHFGQFLRNSLLELPTFVDVDAAMNDRGVQVSIEADPIDNRSAFHVQTSPLQQSFSGRFDLRTTDVELAECIHRYAPELPVRLKMGLAADGRFQWDGKVITLDATSQCGAREIDLAGAPIGEVDCKIRCNASLEPSDLQSLAGSVEANVRSGEFQLDGLRGCRLVDLSSIKDLGGTVSATASAELQLPETWEPSHIIRNVVSQLRIETRGIHAAGIRVADATFAADLQAAQLQMNLSGGEVRDLSGRSIAGLAFNAECDDVLTGILQVKSTTNVADLNVLATLAGMRAGSCLGSAEAVFEASSSVTALTNPVAWNAGLSVSANDLQLIDESIGPVRLVAMLENGVFEVPSTEIGWRQNVCKLQASGRIDERAAVRSHFRSGPISVSDVAEVASRFSTTPLPLSGWIDAEGTLSADLSAGTYECSGRSHLKDAMYESTLLGGASLAWEINPNGLVAKTSSNNLFGGRYLATATVQDLDWTKTKLDIELTAVELRSLAALGKSPLPVAGRLNGQFHLTQLGPIRQWVAAGEVRTDGLRLGQSAIEVSAAKLDIADGRCRASLSGTAFRGDFDGHVDAALIEMQELFQQPEPDLTHLPLTATFSFVGVDPVSIAAVVGQQNALRNAGGFLNLEIDRDASVINREALLRIVASGEGLRWNRVRVSDRVAATMHVYPKRLIINSIEGRVADGKLFGRGEVQLETRPTGHFEMGISRINLRQLASIGGQNTSQFSGTGNLRVDARLDRNVTGHAALTADHAVLGGVQIRSVRLPVDWSYAPSTSTSAWHCRSGTIETGGGRVHLSCDGNYRNALTLQLSSTVSDVDTSKLLAGNSTGAGMVDAQFSLTAKRARSMQEFNGKFDVDLSKLDSMKLPVLDRLPTMLQLVPSRRGRHENVGHVRGRLSGETVYIDTAHLSQSNVQVTASGRATLDGRLDIDLTAATGSTSPTEGLMALTNSPLMLAAPAPAKLLIQANEALKDRVVHVHVGGNSRSPTIRLQPGKQLSQDALRFLISSQFGTSVANAADRVRNDSNQR